MRILDQRKPHKSKRSHLINILALAVIAGLYIHPTSRRMIRAQFPLSAMDSAKPSFEIEIMIDGTPYQDKDRKVRQGLVANLCSPELSAQILSTVAEAQQDPSITELRLDHLLTLTKTEDLRYFIQINPDKVLYPEEILEETRNSLKNMWEHIGRAEILTKNEVKPFRIRVL
jgi:hypothetical protein